MKTFFLVILAFAAIHATSQSQVMHIPLNDLGKDDRFEKFMLTMPIFMMDNDTILTMDFENLKPAKPVKVVKPKGYGYYGYGFIFFTGVPNEPNPGYMNVLVGNVFSSAPHLYVDRNNNYDFTDDGEHLLLPGKRDSMEFPIRRLDDTAAGMTIKLKRLNFDNQPAYRKLMNDYYAYFYKDRKFAGIENSYREQRYITRAGTVSYPGDSFRLGLYDGNANGFYNDPGIDKVITANFADSFFDSRDDLRAFTIPENKGTMYVENQGEQFEVVEIDKAGRSIKLKMMNEQLLLGRTSPGKKIPKFRFTTWKGEKDKIKKYRKYDVYLYFTGPRVSSFSKDTAMLRALAEAYSSTLRIIAFIDVNKSYELKIFGTYSHLNWVAAYKDKEINRLLAVRGLPSSIWLGRRRKVVKYNISPDDFLKEYAAKVAEGKK